MTDIELCKIVEGRGGQVTGRCTCTYTANLLAFRRPKTERGPAVLAIHAGVGWDAFYDLPPLSLMMCIKGPTNPIQINQSKLL